MAAAVAAVVSVVVVGMVVIAAVPEREMDAEAVPAMGMVATTATATG